MKLGFKHSGRQFFFITMVVAERREVLSRVVDESSRPELTRLGEVVVFALRAIHRVWPAATVSDFVIMPDHLHFLLIVDYGNDATFSPLFVAHRLADAVEMVAERTGDAPEPPKEQPTDREAKRALDERKIVFMAERLREAIVAANEAAVRGELKVEKGLRFGEKVVAGSGAVNSASLAGGSGAVNSALLAGGSGAAAPVRSVVFAHDCYIELSFDSRQLKAVRHYIKLNPARRLWKLRHHDLFVCHRAIKAARLAALAPRRFDGLGDLTLLASPFLFHVRLTLKKTLVEHEAAIVEIVEKARRGWVPVSGFISPGEKEALRRLKAEPAARFIKLLPSALPDRYDPSSEDSREIAAGRLAILSAARDTAAISSLAMKRDPAAAHAFRRNCLELNDIAAALCESPL